MCKMEWVTAVGWEADTWCVHGLLWSSDRANSWRMESTDIQHSFDHHVWFSCRAGGTSVTSRECQHWLAVATQHHTNSPEAFSIFNFNLFTLAEHAVSLQDTVPLHVILWIYQISNQNKIIFEEPGTKHKPIICSETKLWFWICCNLLNSLNRYEKLKNCDKIQIVILPWKKS